MSTLSYVGLVPLAAAALWSLHCAWRRFELSRAKHPSLAGHAKLSRRLAALLPYYGYDERRFFSCDGAPEDVAAQRRAAFGRLAAAFRSRSPESIAFSDALASGLSDVQFTDAYRVPFQFRDYVRERLRVGSVADASRGAELRDLDRRWAYDVSGSYGVNLFGYGFYKECIAAGAERVEALGPVLGPFHPIVRDNVERLKKLSGHDEVSFHMSGTEAVMQAVRLAQFHTRRSHIVLFCGAYHGWWDGVQPGLGNRRRVNDVYTLADVSPRSLRVLETRRDIACVLVNPLQALHPNAPAPQDSTLVDGARRAQFDRAAYSRWLEQLREVCTRRGIVLLFDEVFMGFRLGRGGAQEYFGVRADLVTYGKTLGGGLPVGVICGAHRFMKRFRNDRPSDACFARGTFNSHPYVMGAMNELLRRLESDGAVAASYEGLDERWNARAVTLNDRLAAEGLPVRVANLVSVWTVLYDKPSRYNWMFQYYLRAEGLVLSWVGSGRLIFSHNYTNKDFRAVAERFVAAAEAMQADGWWWAPPKADNKTIRRTILREALAAGLRGRGARQPAGVSRLSSGSSSSSSSTAASGPYRTCFIGSMSSPRSKCSGDL
jgi:glutamate-1-semialdehyde 2,1-aminomutase